MFDVVWRPNETGRTHFVITGLDYLIIQLFLAGMWIMLLLIFPDDELFNVRVKTFYCSMLDYTSNG